MSGWKLAWPSIALAKLSFNLAHQADDVVASDTGMPSKTDSTGANGILCYVAGVGATCGNGRDMVALAGMLSPSSYHTNGDERDDHDHGDGNDDDDDVEVGHRDSEASLIEIDVRSRAICNVDRVLTSSSSLSSSSSSSYDDAYRDRVSLVVDSHENLMDTETTSAMGRWEGAISTS